MAQGSPEDPIIIPAGGPWPPGVPGTFYKDASTGQLYRYETGAGYQLRGVPPSVVDPNEPGTFGAGGGFAGGGTGTAGGETGTAGTGGSPMPFSFQGPTGRTYEPPTGFEVFTPQAQFENILSGITPNYNMPGYSNLYQNAFDPLYGRYLLSGTAADTTPFYQYLGGGQGSPYTSFSGGAAPATGYMTPGWATAVTGSALGGPGGADPGGWNTFVAGNPSLSQALGSAENVRQMAMGQYYGGALPSGARGTAVSNAISGLFNRWMQGEQRKGTTSPAGFLSYLSGLGGRFAVPS
jgi:hypothetical protein